MDTNKALSAAEALMKHSMSTIPRKTPRQEKRAMFQSEGFFFAVFILEIFRKLWKNK